MIKTPAEEVNVQSKKILGVFNIHLKTPAEAAMK
jgi:hypothetical protein